MKSILLVEDDEEMIRLLRLHFQPADFKVSASTSGREALQKISAEDYHLIILDIKLPDANGIELCRQIRSENAAVPIMMLTSLVGEGDKVTALEGGADDYITKPFSILELVARTKALLRRAGQQKATREEELQLNYKQLHINKSKRLATLHSKRLDLTVKEFDLLFLLAENAGKTFSRQELLEKVWGYSFAGYEHTVTSHINRLRIKIEEDLAHPRYILTSCGTGYRFADEK